MAASPQRAPIDPTVSPAELIERHGADILASDGMRAERTCVQHGSTSVFEHSVAVTVLTLTLAQRWGIPVYERTLMRGSLLHDYFLYDWHDSQSWHRLHGFRHPFFARDNAVRDFSATPHEQAMIRTHMFPLVPLPPTSREAALLCLADKIVATGEIMAGMRMRLSHGLNR